MQNCSINECLSMFYAAILLIGPIFILFSKMRSSKLIRQYVKIIAKRVGTHNHSKCEGILMSTSRSQEFSSFLAVIFIYKTSTFFYW